MDLAGRKFINRIEDSRETDISPYAKTGSRQNQMMVEAIGKQLKYQKLQDTGGCHRIAQRKILYPLLGWIELFLNPNSVGEAMIESFSFGRMVVHGKAYSNDLIIFPDGRIQDSWWRQKGHQMTLQDIADLVAAAPDVIVAGTGVYGYMKPDQEVSRVLKERGIRFVPEPTGEAWQTYNDLADSGHVGACFHVGC